jgi:type IV pilus assembly protein PilW
MRAPRRSAIPDAERRACCAWPMRARSSRPVRQRGTTLVELAIAMTVGLLVLGTVGVIFGGTSHNRASLERAARLTENANYALNVIRNDVAQAGYYDTLTTTAGGFTWQLRDPCLTALADLGWSNPIGTPPPVNAKLEHAPVPIFGIRAADAAPACIPDRKPGTAIVVVRFVGPDATVPANAIGAPFIQLSKCDLETPNKLNLGVVSNDPAAFTMHNIGCATVADVKRFVVRTYYVANCDRCGIDTIPTLKRAELVGNEIVITPLAEGIEDLQVEYGIDANGDGTPDRYLESPDPALGAGFGEWSNVMAVRLYLLARSTNVEPGYKDATRRFNLGPAGYKTAAPDGNKRVLVTSLVRPMNPAGQRETQ